MDWTFLIAAGGRGWPDVHLERASVLGRWAFCLAVLGSLPGCRAALDLDQQPERAGCEVPGSRRCSANAPQVCTDYQWQDVPPQERCFGATSVCGEGACLSIQEVSAGGDHSCVLRSDGQVSCWGRNDDGQVGDGAFEDRIYPVHVGGVQGVTTISGGGWDQHGVSFAVANRRVYCWGHDGVGELGDRGQEDLATPIEVPGVDDVVQVSTGASHACALHENGEVTCWGENLYNEIAPSGEGPAILGPTRIEGLSGVRAISAGRFYTCAITDHEVLCWGYNRFHQCGQEDAGPVFPPQVVPGIHEPTQISAGYGHVCAVEKTGPPWASTIRFASARPSPSPPMLRVRLRSARKKGRTIFGRSSAEMLWRRARGSDRGALGAPSARLDGCGGAGLRRRGSGSRGRSVEITSRVGSSNR